MDEHSMVLDFLLVLPMTDIAIALYYLRARRVVCRTWRVVALVAIVPLALWPPQ
jgi:hypothetical protein